MSSVKAYMMNDGSVVDTQDDLLDRLKSKCECQRIDYRGTRCIACQGIMEIKTLRSECKRLIHEAAFMQQSRDEEKKWRKIAIDDSNEWKRRARWMWDNRESYFMPATHSKITKWFEEE